MMFNSMVSYKLSAVPKGKWFCPDCRKEGKGKKGKRNVSYSNEITDLQQCIIFLMTCSR